MVPSTPLAKIIHKGSIKMHSIGIFLSLLPGLHSYSSGAPGYKNVCVDMEPGHRVPSQPLSTFPLSLTNKQELRSENYNENGFVTFKIEGAFKGVIFQVRDESGKAVGQFCSSSLPDSMKFVEACSKYSMAGASIPSKATLTHRASNMKNEVDLVWKSGGEDFGTVRLYASVAQSYAQVWVMKSMVKVKG